MSTKKKTTKKKTARKKTTRKKTAKKKSVKKIVKTGKKPQHEFEVKEKNTDGSKYVTPDEAEKMFNVWYQIRDKGKDGGLKGVAHIFGRSRTTVFRASRKYKWAERAKKIDQKVAESNDKKIIKKKISSLDLVSALQKKTANELLRPGDINPSVNDFTSLTRLKEELEMNLPIAGEKEEQIPQESMNKLLTILESIDENKIIKMFVDDQDSDAK